MASATKQSKPPVEGDVKEVQALIEKVDNLQGDIDKLNEQASEEILKVEQKYNKQRQPLFQQRSDLLSRIPHFWITVFINHPQIGSLMSEDDEEILQHLTKLEVQEFDDIKSGYKITMHFEKNPFFKNESIVKEFKMNDAGHTSTKSTPIDWHPGKNILAKNAKKDKDGANAKGERKRKHDDEANASLMRWFLADQLGDDSFSEADELAELIKDEVWPNPLQFYLASDEDDDEDDDDAVGLDGADVVDDDDDDGEDDGGLDDEEGDGEDLDGGDDDGADGE